MGDDCIAAKPLVVVPGFGFEREAEDEERPEPEGTGTATGDSVEFSWPLEVSKVRFLLFLFCVLLSRYRLLNDEQRAKIRRRCIDLLTEQDDVVSAMPRHFERHPCQLCKLHDAALTWLSLSSLCGLYARIPNTA